MNRNTSRRGSARRNNRSGKSSDNQSDTLIANSLHASGRGDVVNVPDDTRRRLPSWQLTERPPRNFLNQIVWLKETYTTSLTLSGAGAIVENNPAPTLAQFPSVGAIAALYDQFCIYALVARACLDVQIAGTATATSYGRIYSAIDYDSSAAAGTEALMLRFGTVQVSELVPGKSYERFVKPCVALVTGASNSASNTGTAQSRQWLNSVLQTTPHFGFRFMTVGNTNIGANTVIIYITAVIGLRNNT